MRSYTAEKEPFLPPWSWFSSFWNGTRARRRLPIVMKAHQILKRIATEEAQLTASYCMNHAGSISVVTSVRQVRELKEKPTAQVTASGGAAFTIKGHLRFIPSFESCTKWLKIYHTGFSDVMAEGACLWWGVWYQMAGLTMPLAACSQRADRSFYDRNQCVQQF